MKKQETATLHDIILKPISDKISAQENSFYDDRLRQDFLEKLKLGEYGAKQLLALFSAKNSEEMSVFLSAVENLDYELLKTFFAALNDDKNLSITQREITDFINQQDQWGRNALWLTMSDVSGENAKILRRECAILLIRNGVVYQAMPQEKSSDDENFEDVVGEVGILDKLAEEGVIRENEYLYLKEASVIKRPPASKEMAELVLSKARRKKEITDSELTCLHSDGDSVLHYFARMYFKSNRKDKRLLKDEELLKKILKDRKYCVTRVKNKSGFFPLTPPKASFIEAVKRCDLQKIQEILSLEGRGVLIYDDESWNLKTALTDLVRYKNKDFVAMLFLITKSFSGPDGNKFDEVEKSYGACGSLSNICLARDNFVDVINSIYSRESNFAITAKTKASMHFLSKLISDLKNNDVKMLQSIDESTKAGAKEAIVKQFAKLCSTFSSALIDARYPIYSNEAEQKIVDSAIESFVENALAMSQVFSARKEMLREVRNMNIYLDSKGMKTNFEEMLEEVRNMNIYLDSEGMKTNFDNHRQRSQDSQSTKAVADNFSKLLDLEKTLALSNEPLPTSAATLNRAATNYHRN